MQIFTATFVKNKCIFLTILLQQKLAHNYEFLVVFGQVRVWDRKSAGRVRPKFLKLLRVRGRFKLCRCGAGADTKFQPVQDSSLGLC